MKYNRENEVFEFKKYLLDEERSAATIEKYLRDVNNFLDFSKGEKLSKEVVISWKCKIMAMYKPSSVNSMLTSVNRYLDWIGQADCKVKFIKVQRQIFLREEKDLKEWEYRKLLEEANRKSNKQLAVLLQTIAMTGIRISELQYITIEGMKAGRIDVANKGKIRTILLPKELIKVLQKHVKESHIVDGIIFKTKHDKALDRSNIWKMMKRLAKDAGVQLAKVFPHNLRHLFAKTFYKIKKDISKLADMLGHSNINTTRIYIMETGSNHINGLNKMNVLLI